MESNPITNLTTPPSWLEKAFEFSMVKTRHNLATLSDFPERTEGGQWVQIAPDMHGCWMGGWARGDFGLHLP